MSGPVETQLRQRLEAALKPATLEIQNESPNHNLPPSAEKHFRVFVVAQGFEGQSRIERHREVHAAAGDLLNGKIHALAVQAKTPTEVAANAHKITSPACAHSPKDKI